MTTMEEFIKKTEIEMDKLNHHLKDWPNDSECAGEYYGHACVLKCINENADRENLLKALDEEHKKAEARKPHNRYFFTKKAFIIDKAIVDLVTLDE